MVFTLDKVREVYHDSTSVDFQVVGEVFVSINHSVLTIASDLDKVERVYSHPQVWGQCDKWVDAKLKGIEKIDTSSTSKAVELVKNDPTGAAIASEAAGIVHGVPVFLRNISNNANNTTRFLIFSKSSLSRQQDKLYGTLVSFKVEHRVPGALCNALAAFGRQKVNLTSITSRPSGKVQWTYVFFVEFDGHQDDERIKMVIDDMERYCLEYKVIGSFERNCPKDNSDS